MRLNAAAPAAVVLPAVFVPGLRNTAKPQTKPLPPKGATAQTKKEKTLPLRAFAVETHSDSSSSPALLALRGLRQVVQHQTILICKVLFHHPLYVRRRHCLQPRQIG